MKSYSGLNRTIVIEALRSDHILEKGKKKLLLDFMWELPNLTSYLNLTALFNLRCPTSWTSSPSILSAHKTTNALPFFLTCRVLVHSQPRDLAFAMLHHETLLPQNFAWLTHSHQSASSTVTLQRSHPWPYYIEYHPQELIPCPDLLPIQRLLL